MKRMVRKAALGSWACECRSCNRLHQSERNVMVHVLFRGEFSWDGYLMHKDTYRSISGARDATPADFARIGVLFPAPSEFGMSPSEPNAAE